MIIIQKTEIDPSKVAKWELSGGSHIPYLEMKIIFRNGNESNYKAYTDETKTELKDAQNELVKLFVHQLK